MGTRGETAEIDCVRGQPHVHSALKQRNGMQKPHRVAQKSSAGGKAELGKGEKQWRAKTINREQSGVLCLHSVPGMIVLPYFTRKSATDFITHHTLIDKSTTQKQTISPILMVVQSDSEFCT